MIIISHPFNYTHLRIKHQGSGYKVKLKSLAFVDDLMIITKNKQETRYAVESLYRIVPKVSLQISYKKTKYMDDLCQNCKKTQLEIEYGMISQMSSFKCLGENRHPKLDSWTNKERAIKLQKSYRLQQKTDTEYCEV